MRGYGDATDHERPVRTIVFLATLALTAGGAAGIAQGASEPPPPVIEQAPPEVVPPEMRSEPPAIPGASPPLGEVPPAEGFVLPPPTVDQGMEKAPPDSGARTPVIPAPDGPEPPAALPQGEGRSD